MSWYVDCVNCGKQVSIEPSDDVCYWCHNPALIKVSEKKLEENIKEAKMGTGGNRQAKHRFVEEHKSEIIADYLSLGKEKILEKWEISGSGWIAMQKRWKSDIETASKDVATKVDKKLTKKLTREKPVRDYQKKYRELLSRHEGYRQAILDTHGQVEVKPNKE